MDVLVADGPDTGLLWHAGNPFAEQRLAADGHGVALLANREVFTVADSGRSRWFWAEPGQAEALDEQLRAHGLCRGETVRRPDVTVLWLGRLESVPGAALGRRPSPVAGGQELFWPVTTPIPPCEPVGVWALDALRIEAGVPRAGLDVGPRGVPAGRRLVRLWLDGALPQSGAQIRWRGARAGTVGSVAQHHEMGPIALGLLDAEVPEDAQVMVESDDSHGIDATTETVPTPAWPQ